MGESSVAIAGAKKSPNLAKICIEPSDNTSAYSPSALGGMVTPARSKNDGKLHPVCCPSEKTGPPGELESGTPFTVARTEAKEWHPFVVS